jgi:7,8-dihydropterin-6-yl-methyl-4-(beta-D-ribofuranosyl)aminobenzene 5'-phosphate synthase
MCEDATADRRRNRSLVVPVELGLYGGETLPLQPVAAVRITTLVDNSTDMLMTDMGPAKRPVMGRGLWTDNPLAVQGTTPQLPLAEHGFSALVEVVQESGAVRRVLFDTGVSPDGMVENMRRLEIDPGTVEVVVCSHGHFDHTTGLDGFVRRLGRPNVPVVIHPAFWSQRRVAFPGREPFELPSPSRRSLEDAGFEIVELPEPSFLFDGSVLITGEVARTTDFEKGLAHHEVLQHGHWNPDPLILDDQALVVNVRGRGLVVVTGCGHAGVVNIVRYARHLTAVESIHAVIGGFHLSGPLFEPIIAATVAALVELGPDVVVPAHCTGWRAELSLARALPDAYIPNSVGTRLELTAA